MNVIEEILTACASSAKAPKLKLMQKHGYFETRSQIHVMIILPFGAGKTTGIVQIPKTHFHMLTEFTAPGMLGSMTKDGRPVIGEIVKAAGKCVGLDEFQKYSWKAKEALLNLLEQQFYVRNIGYSSNIAIRKHTKYYRIDLKQGDNTMRIESRFSTIATGMFKPNMRIAGSEKEGPSASITEWAFLSRFVPFSLKLDLEDMYKIIAGQPVFELKKLHTYDDVPVFDKYLDMVKQHYKIAKGLTFLSSFSPNKYGLITRNCLDIARLSAYCDRGSGSVDNFDKWLNFVPFLLYNHVSSTLTNNEFLTLNLACFENLCQKEIAKKLGFSQPYVSKTMAHLNDLGLLIKPENLLLDGNIKEVSV